MALSGDELSNRVKAAGALHGLGMRKIRDALEDYGANRTLAESMISGEVPQNPRNIRDLSEALGMPQSWFTEEDWRPLISGAPPIESELGDKARVRARRALEKDRRRSQQKPRAKRQKREGE